MSKIGLVAGAGELPLIFAKNARAKGHTVVALGLKGVSPERLSDCADKVHWFEWGDLKRALLIAVTERLNKITLLGKINKEMLFKESGKFDDEARKIVKFSGGKNDYSILKQIAGLVRVAGIEIIDPTPYLEEIVPVKGVLTGRKPTRTEKEDIEYGRKVASELAGLDIGQTIAVKEKTVVALEAAEGTDETIRRAGALTGGEFTVVKMARPHQDARFDIPLVGLETVKTLAEAKGSVLALQEKKTFLMDRDAVVEFANAHGIVITVI